jgi:aminoglycoside 6'-N-acetyltransferase
MPVEARYSFRPVAEGDLAMLRQWLAAPHVARWWGDPDEEIAGIREHMRSESVRPYIVMLEGEPLGYIQSYDMDREADHPYAPQPARTFGIDQSIGSEALTGKGHGPAMMRAFCARLFEKGASRIITDPDFENLNAIRAYEKAGFTKDKIVTSEYGTVWLMTLDGETKAPE